jgi:hypothetical protein
MHVCMILEVVIKEDLSVDEAPTMDRDAGIGLLRRTPSAPDKPCQAAVSPAAPALSTLSHVDQEDALSSHAALLPLARLSTRSQAQCGPQSRPDIDRRCNPLEQASPQLGERSEMNEP